MLCSASYWTGDPGVYKRCVNPGDHWRVSRVDSLWVVQVHLCMAHAELWDDACPRVEVAHGGE